MKKWRFSNFVTMVPEQAGVTIPVRDTEYGNPHSPNSIPEDDIFFRNKLTATLLRQLSMYSIP